MRRVLLDHCVPRPFRNLLVQCAVSTAYEMGWAQLKNGELLDAAESAGFEVLITADQSLRHQQNLSGRRIAIVELPTNRMRQVDAYAVQANAILASISPGTYTIVAS